MLNPTPAAAVLAMHLATYPVHATLPVTNSVDSGITPPAPQTQVASLTTSSSASFAGHAPLKAPKLPRAVQEKINRNKVVLQTLREVQERFDESTDYHCNGTSSAYRVRQCHEKILSEMQLEKTIENLAMEGDFYTLEQLALAAKQNTK